MPGPGVIVQTGSVPGPSTVDLAPASTYFNVGLAERGDTVNPILVRSMAEYAQKLGNRVTYGALFDDLSAFFGEGGAQAYVARVVGPAATKGSLVLVDRAGSPLSTLTVTAANEGSWSGNLTVSVVNSAITNQFLIQISLSGTLVEQWGPFPDPATAAAKISQPAANGGSNYVTVTNNASVTVAPNNNPAVVTNVALSAGTDDRGSVTGTVLVNALARFSGMLGAGAVAIPGQDASVVGAGLIAHCQQKNRRIALLCPPIGTTPAAAQTEAATFRGSGGFQEGAGFFWPWIKIPDGSGGTRTVSPEGAIAGARAQLQISGQYPSQPPAGEFGRFQWVVDVEQMTDGTTYSNLNANNVNCIRNILGPLLYGWRSLSTDTANYYLLSGRDLMNYVVALGETALQPFVFRTVDGKGHMFSDMANALVGILQPIAAAGGLYPSWNGQIQVDPGYLVDTGPDINTPQLLQTSSVAASVEMRVSPDAETINLQITKVAFPNAL